MAPCICFVVAVDRLPQERFKGWVRNTTQFVDYMPSMIQKLAQSSTLHKPRHSDKYLQPQHSMGKIGGSDSQDHMWLHINSRRDINM